MESDAEIANVLSFRNQPSAGALELRALLALCGIEERLQPDLIVLIGKNDLLMFWVELP
ncbi:MAG: hypothetical protein U1G07_16495 [Verrucomicrobiota bacterium]